MHAKIDKWKKKEFVSKKKKKEKQLLTTTLPILMASVITNTRATILVHLKCYLDLKNDVQISLGRGLDCVCFLRRMGDSNLRRQS